MSNTNVLNATFFSSVVNREDVSCGGKKSETKLGHFKSRE